MSRLNDYELSHLILRFEQEKDMKVMHCVQNLGALRDLVDMRIEVAGLKHELTEAKERERQSYSIISDIASAMGMPFPPPDSSTIIEHAKDLESANTRLREALTGLDNLWSRRVHFSGGITNPGFENEMNSRLRAALTVPPAKEKP